MADAEFLRWFLRDLLRFNERGHCRVVGQQLVNFAEWNRIEVGEFVREMSPQCLVQVCEFLDLYPMTGVGWSMLPKELALALREGLSLDEMIDIGNRQFQEDRHRVEFLRRVAKARLEELGLKRPWLFWNWE